MDSVTNYNIANSLNGLPEDILIQIIHTFNNGSDIQQFLITSRPMSRTTTNKYFIWAVSPSVAATYLSEIVYIHSYPSFDSLFTFLIT